MRSMAMPVLGLVMVAVTALALPARANYLTNPDFGIDLSGWQGDGERTYLKADGTEGSETDSDAVPVIKITLTHGHARFVTQQIDMSKLPDGMHVQVDVYASSDFQRSKFDGDYTSTRHFPTMWDMQQTVPEVDFWIQMGPTDGFMEWQSTTSDLKPGQWKTVKAIWPEGEKPGEQFAVYFYAPPGDGAIYLKNPVAQK